jgi:uncharacterized membrane protein YbaN (DUF454 family)
MPYQWSLQQKYMKNTSEKWREDQTVNRNEHLRKVQGATTVLCRAADCSILKVSLEALFVLISDPLIGECTCTTILIAASDEGLRCAPPIICPVATAQT